MATPDERELEVLAIDAFNVFGANPERWPERVIFDRNGTADVNIRGTWAIEKRSDFYTVEFTQLDRDPSPTLALYPDSSGESV